MDVASLRALIDETVVAGYQPERGCEGDSAGEGLGRQPLGLFADRGR